MRHAPPHRRHPRCRRRRHRGGRRHRGDPRPPDSAMGARDGRHRRLGRPLARRHGGVAARQSGAASCHAPRRLPGGRRHRSGIGILRALPRPARVRGLHRDLRRSVRCAGVEGGRVAHGRGHRLSGLRRPGDGDRAHLCQPARRSRAVAGDPPPRARVRASAARRGGRDGVARSGLGSHSPRAGPDRGRPAGVGRDARAHRPRRGGGAGRPSRARSARVRRRAPGARR